MRERDLSFSHSHNHTHTHIALKKSPFSEFTLADTGKKDRTLCTNPQVVPSDISFRIRSGLAHGRLLLLPQVVNGTVRLTLYIHVHRRRGK